LFLSFIVGFVRQSVIYLIVVVGKPSSVGHLPVKTFSKITQNSSPSSSNVYSLSNNTITIKQYTIVRREQDGQRSDSTTAALITTNKSVKQKPKHVIKLVKSNLVIKHEYRHNNVLKQPYLLYCVN